MTISFRHFEVRLAYPGWAGPYEISLTGNFFREFLVVAMSSHRKYKNRSLDSSTTAPLHWSSSVWFSFPLRGRRKGGGAFGDYSGHYALVM